MEDIFKSDNQKVDDNLLFQFFYSLTMSCSEFAKYHTLKPLGIGIKVIALKYNIGCVAK